MTSASASDLDLLSLTARGATELLASSEVSPAELAEAYLDRIEQDPDQTNAFLHVDRATTRASVAHAETLGGDVPLRGVPLAIKDLLSTKDMPTTCGSKILEGFHPVYDATSVALAREAGLVNLGKVNMDEFAMGSSNETSAYGPVRNPWDPTKVPGGSSGGSAAAVAGGFAPWALGSDTGGSIRQPASLCGIVGMKPTYGVVSRYGLIAFASSLDQIGPMTKDVEDCATLLGVIASADPADSTSVGPREPIALEKRDRLDGVRLGLPRQFMAEGIDPDVKAVIEENLRQAVDLGAAIVDVDLPHAEYALAAYYLIAPAEASSNLARFDGVRYGLRVDADSLGEMYDATRAQGFGLEVQRRIMIGTYALSSGYYDAYYGQAQKVRTLIARDFEKVFEHCDLVVGPTSPTTAFGIGERMDDPLAMYASDICTIPTNLAALPGMSIPSGLSGGLPVGFQLIGPAFSENKMLSTAWALEQAFEFDPVAPRLRTDHGRRHRVMTLQAELTETRMDAWEPVIGLEIHLQLSTNTKMFCRCRLEFGAAPNTHVCPVCLAHPGVLPVPNRRAVDFAVMIGLALNCEIADRTTFSRKNYFYADSPKAYQISQYEDPICGPGHLDVPDGAGGSFRVGITRAHMEEDAAKLVHAGSSGRIANSSHSFVDFNRVGTPLVEVVTDPDIRTPEQARRFLQLLKNTIETLGVSDCNMEEGSLRCDANISVRRRGETELGTKTELKNMNSFRFIERGIHAELARQVDLIERGEAIEQATMHYDPTTGSIRQLRSKEAAHDYRYFPEPDLVPIEVDAAHVERVRAEMTELPMARMHRFEEQYGLSAYDAEVLNASSETADFYEAAVAAANDADAKLVANWTMGELQALQKDDKSVEPAQLAALVDLVAKKTISGAVAKELLVRIADEGIDPAAVVEAEGLGQVSDEGALRDVIVGILDANPKQVEQYKGGKESLVGFFVGGVMKAMQGKADPGAAKALIVELLAER